MDPNMETWIRAIEDQVFDARLNDVANRMLPLEEEGIVIEIPDGKYYMFRVFKKEGNTTICHIKCREMPIIYVKIKKIDDVAKTYAID